MDIKVAVGSAAIPVAVLALITFLFEVFELAVKYFGLYYLAAARILLIPLAFVMFAIAGYIAVKRHDADRLEGAFSGCIAGLLYGIIAAVLMVIFLFLLSYIPNKKDIFGSFIVTLVPSLKDVGTLTTKLLCAGITIPLSIILGLLAGYAGAWFALRKKG